MAKNILVRNWKFEYLSKFVWIITELEECLNKIETPHAKQNQHKHITNLSIPGLPDQIKRVSKKLILKLSSQLKIQLEWKFQ